MTIDKILMGSAATRLEMMTNRAILSQVCVMVLSLAVFSKLARWNASFASH